MVKWECISNDGTERLKVPGGWLVRCPAFNEVKQVSAGMIVGKSTVITGICILFLPDPNYQWRANDDDKS